MLESVPLYDCEGHHDSERIDPEIVVSVREKVPLCDSDVVHALLAESFDCEEEKL